MITLTRLDGRELVVNADHVLTVDATPDTVLVLTTGLHVMVKEPVREVVDRAAAWKRRVALGPELRATVIPLPRGEG
ncbi:MAG TPA: flagellar FlbD family protein [Anaeromyxobacteraceae bacterium]|nr:flagellar FlbD family protein [Anaeromyxobacteraceae bacterium]